MPGKLIDGPDDHLNFTPYAEEGGNQDPLLGARVDDPSVPEKQVTQPVSQVTEETLSGDDVPEKYRNKSARELLDVIQNQESTIGRMSNEVGDARKRIGTLEGLVDRALTLRDPGHEPPESVSEEDLNDQFQTDPVGTTSRVVTQAVEQATAPLVQEVNRLQAKSTAEDFQRAHPTAPQDINSQEFIDYVGASEYRKNLANKAFGEHEQGKYDFEAADELWSGWEEHQKASAPAAGEQDLEGAGAPQATEQPATQPTVPAQEPTSLIPGGSAGDAGNSDGKPRYSWAALADLQAKNPDYYWRDDVQAKINTAIAEGRVVSP